MKRILSAAVLAVSFTAVIAAQAPIRDLTGLARMAGCWERRDDSKKLLISEQWMSPAGTSILGMGRTVKDGTTTGWEFMRIEMRADGLYFVSRPHENTEDTDFKLLSSTADEVVFQNKAHDFPQRVIYKLGDKKMTGRIEGVLPNGKFRGIDFPMERVACK